MPGGWHAPGAACAHDVDAFLAGATADGATNLVGGGALGCTGRRGARAITICVWCF